MIVEHGKIVANNRNLLFFKQFKKQVLDKLALKIQLDFEITFTSNFTMLSCLVFEQGCNINSIYTSTVCMSAFTKSYLCHSVHSYLFQTKYFSPNQKKVPPKYFHRVHASSYLHIPSQKCKLISSSHSTYDLITNVTSSHPWRLFWTDIFIDTVTFFKNSRLGGIKARAF